MNKSTYYILKNLTLLVVLLSVISCSEDVNKSFNEDQVKVSLRDVGHHLLLINQDSLSLVKPVVAIDEYKYQLAFENTLVIQPDSLVNHIRNSFKKTDLPQFYLVEVIKCEDGEVAYSYEMKEDVEKGIIPCGGRQLHLGCYNITVRFTEAIKLNTYDQRLLYFLALGILLLLVLIVYKRNFTNNPEGMDENYSAIGIFKFYPEQSKLVKQAKEISLSKKECEILSLFVASPNQIIKRDELSKKVWEDQGVFVGRSLDTYISKLRKKLQDDDSIKLTNVHGIGYKLEFKS